MVKTGNYNIRKSNPYLHTYTGTNTNTGTDTNTHTHTQTYRRKLLIYNQK